jgi:hypothetical protein
MVLACCQAIILQKEQNIQPSYLLSFISYLIPPLSGIVPGTPGVEVGVTENLVLNEATRIIGVTPNLPSGKDWNIKIRTKYSGGGAPLKETREIMSTFTVHTV